jgi:type IV secretory pathway protease TraF
MEPYWQIRVEGTPMSASELVLRKIDPPGRSLVAWSDCAWQPPALSTAT